MQAIAKECVALAASGLAWATVMRQKELQAASYHELVISTRPAPRLDDLSATEEDACWSLAWERGREAVRNGQAEAICIAVNDGVAARQSVGHVHMHVLAVRPRWQGVLVPHGLNKLTAIFRDCAATTPLDSRSVQAGPASFAGLRAVRKNAAADSGHTVILHDFITATSDEMPQWLVETWSGQNPREFSVTNLFRVWNGFRASPHSSASGVPHIFVRA